jgi:hypothetical protein
LDFELRNADLKTWFRSKKIIKIAAKPEVSMAEIRNPISQIEMRGFVLLMRVRNSHGESF